MNMQTIPVKATSIAPLKNVAAMLVLIDTIRNRPQTSSGLGVFSGPSGYGKTVASTYAVNRSACLYIEVRDFWTRKSFCEALLEELGVKPKGTIAAMMKEIGYVLGSDVGRAVIIDEADKLVDKGMIELVRDVYEMTAAPVILVGEEKLPAKLEAFERVHGRVLSWVLAQPCDLEDTRVLATLIAPGVDIADDLLNRIRDQTDGRTRRIANTLHELAIVARNSGVRAFSAESYAGRIFTGQAPVRGRGVR